MGIIKKLIDSVINKSVWTMIYNNSYAYKSVEKSIPELLQYYKNWNYLCINLVANHIINIKYYLMKNNEEIKDEVLLNLISQPNKLMNYEDFMEKVILWLELTGNSFIWKIRNGNNKIIELFPIRPDAVKINLDSYGNIVSYTYRSLANDIEIKYDDIIHIKHASPDNYYWGKAPTEAILSLIDMDEEIRVHEKAYFQNGGIPAYLLIAKTRMSEAEFKRLKQEWTEAYTGSTQSHRPAFLTGDIEIKTTGITPKDQQFTLLSKWIKDSILHTYFIPSGIFESATTIATALQADVIFQREAILPRLKKIWGAFTNKLAKEFDIGYYFDYDNPVPRDREFELKRNIAYVNAGILTINEVRKIEGYDEVEWGDEPYSVNSLKIKEQPVTKQVNKNDNYKKWYEYIQERRLVEIELKQKIIEMFNYIGKNTKDRLKVLRTIQKGVKLDDILFTDEDLEKIIISYIRNPWAKVYEKFGKKEIEHLNKYKLEEQKGYDIKIDWNIELPFIKENINKILNKGIKEIAGYTRQVLRDKIAQAIKEGLSYEDICNIIDETISEWNTGKSRAWMIARTETTTASHAGKFMADKMVEEKYKVNITKVWITSIDERTRGNNENDEFNHLIADGEEVELDEPFRATGEQLMYPGDKNGSPGNIINCRCSYATNISKKEEE